MDLPNAFIGKAAQPTSSDISAVIGRTAKFWNSLVESLAREFGVTNQKWKSSSPKYGWTLILSFKRRRIVYLTPCTGCFRASFVLGDRAVSAARQVGLSKPTLKILDEAPHYPEGRGVRLTVKAARDLAAARKLAKIKLAN